MNVKESIRLLALSGLELYCKICKVDTVDESKRTIDCTPIDEGAPLLGVNLQADQSSEDGCVFIPAANSYVAVAFLNDNTAVVVLTEKIDKIIVKIGSSEAEIIDGTMNLAIDGTTLKIDSDGIVINDGTEKTPYGDKLQAQLNKMSGRIDAIINAFSSAVVVPSDGGTSFKASLIATLAPQLTPACKENFGQVLDDKILH